MPDQQVGVSYNADYKDLENLNRVCQELLKTEKEWQRQNEAIAKSLSQFTPGISKATDAVVKESAALRKSTEAQIAKVEAQDAALQKQLQWKDANEKARASYQAVTGSIKSQRENLLQLESAINRIRNSRQQLTASEQGQLAALRQIAAQQRINMQAQRQLEQAQRQAEAATKKHTDALSANIKKLVLWGVGARTVFAIISRLRTELRDVTTELYGNTEEWKNLQKTIKGFEFGLVAVIANSEDVKTVLDSLAFVVERFGTAAILAISGVRGQFVALYTLGSGIFERLKAEADALVSGTAGELGRFDFGALLDKSAQAGWEETKRSIKEAFEAVDQGKESVDDNAEAEKRFKKALDDARSALEKFDAEAKRHAEAVSDIQNAWAKSTIGAFREGFDEQAEITRDLEKKLAKIEADALKAREKAIKASNKRIAQAQKQLQDDLAKMIEQHNLEMRQAEQRYALTSIQNERLYQYERGRLLAEGDVLAIEELDARYELEKQAREENFKLEQQQAEAMFQLQLRYQQQALQQQIQALEDALGDQLAAIEENRIEERAEAMAAAEEKREEARDALRTELDDLLSSAAEKLSNEEKSHDDRLKGIAEFWAQSSVENGLGLNDTVKLWNSTLGLNGELDGIITEAYKRDLQLTTNFTNDYERIMGSIPTAARNAANQAAVEMQRIIAGAAAAAAAMSIVSGAYGGYAGGGGRPYGGGAPFRQAGGPVEAGHPYVVGERGPELFAPRQSGTIIPNNRLIVQPMSPLMATGNLSLQWSGNPIPVRGEGSLSGVDMQALADGISIGILNKLNATFGSRYGIRGR